MRVCKQCLTPLIKWQNTFCSRSCSAKFNNKFAPKRKPNNDKFCSCGNRKSGTAKKCVDCWLNQTGKKTLLEVVSKYKGSLKWVAVRKDAKNKMNRWKIKKECQICGWNKHVEVNHKKKISDFSLDTLVSEVNSKSNLQYLCPNCHWEFEHNMTPSSNS